jgi:GTP-binding protein Era
MFKSGFVTIIGRPNVGKSTLINHIMGEKLSIVSSRPQTTRNNIQTIHTTKEHQIVFVDTPGMHKPRHKLGEYMVKVAKDSVNEVDVVLFLTTPEEEVNAGDMHILEQLKECNVPVFLLVNKIDENPENRIAKTLVNYSEVFSFKEIIPMAAINGKNVDKVTDLIEIIHMKKDEKGRYNIEANLLCEKDSHKGIIIGKNGAMMKKISTYARQDLEKFLNTPVTLKLWVKVKKDWRDSQFMLKELGYK